MLKPITFDRFFKAVERYFRKNPIVQQTIPPAIPDTIKDAFIIVKSGNKHHKIATQNISYIESLKDYVKIHTADKRIISKYKISNIEKELAYKSFLRVHRSYIVNLEKVTAFTPHDIEIGTVEIPIGASYKELVLNTLNR